MLTLITGATSGIGEACARRFAALGHRLVLTGRREARLQALAASLGAPVHTLCFDIRDPQAVQQALDSLPADWQDIDVLVNNAGLAAGLDPLHKGSLNDWEQMIDTNVKGLLYVSRIVSQGMVTRGRGHILNIGSIAGKEVYPNGNVYCASKHAVWALSQGMRMDLLPYGIRVTHIAPGMAETEFSLVRFKGDTARSEKVYESLTPLSGDDVAQVAVFAATLPPHVCLNDVVVMPTAQASAGQVHRTL